MSNYIDIKKFLSLRFSGVCSAGQKDAGSSIFNHSQNTIQLSSCKQKYQLAIEVFFGGFT